MIFAKAHTLIVKVCSVFLLVAALLPQPASAQTPTYDMVDKSFTLYGKTHVLTRPADASQIAFNIEPLKEAIAHAVSVYSALWEPFAPDLWLELDPGTDTISAGAFYGSRSDVPVPGSTPRRFTNKAVCYVRIFNKIARQDAEGQQFIIAHEIAHCYQFKFVPIANTVLRSGSESAELAQQWWSEGSATWLATKAYHNLPANDPVFNRLSSNFAQHHADSLLGSTDYQFSYDGLFFWEAMEHNIGASLTLKFLATLPAAIPAQQQYFTRHNGADLLFNNYGLFAAWGDLLYQPPAESLFTTIPGVATIPGTTPAIPIRKFSINPLAITLPAGSERGVNIKATGLTASGATVRLLSGETLRDGVAVPVCGLTASKLELVASRTSKGTSDQIQFSFTSYNCPTSVSASIGNCYVGVWHLQTMPHFGTGDLNISLESDLQLTIKSTGATILWFNNFSTIPVLPAKHSNRPSLVHC